MLDCLSRCSVFQGTKEARVHLSGQRMPCQQSTAGLTWRHTTLNTYSNDLTINLLYMQSQISDLLAIRPLN